MQNITLADLPLKQTAMIGQLHFDGEFRRRLLDLGFSSGNPVTPLFQSPLGDPTVYCIMGSMIALRRVDAHRITLLSSKEEGFQ